MGTELKVFLSCPFFSPGLRAKQRRWLLSFVPQTIMLFSLREKVFSFFAHQGSMRWPPPLDLFPARERNTYDPFRGNRGYTGCPSFFSSFLGGGSRFFFFLSRPLVGAALLGLFVHLPASEEDALLICRVKEQGSFPQDSASMLKRCRKCLPPLTV